MIRTGHYYKRKKEIKMKLKKVCALAMAGLMLTGLVSGCGKKDIPGWRAWLCLLFYKSTSERYDMMAADTSGLFMV